MFDKYKDTDRNTTDYQPYFTVDEPIAESGGGGNGFGRRGAAASSEGPASQPGDTCIGA